MLHIQWFPGHMTRALRMMEDSVKSVDCIIYVLDARAIESCMNPKFDNIIKNKPVLYIINKQDLVEKQDLQSWQKYFIAHNMDFVIADSVSGKQEHDLLASGKTARSDIQNGYSICRRRKTKI